MTVTAPKTSFDIAEMRPLLTLPPQRGCGVTDCTRSEAECPLNGNGQNRQAAQPCKFSAEELLSGMQRREFTLRFQPVIDLQNGRHVGAEALIRWEHGGQERSPGVFLPWFNTLGLLSELDFYVVCRVIDLARAIRSIPAGLHLFLNVYAPTLLEPGFLALLETAAVSLAARQARLVVEIVEHAHARPEEILPALNQARSGGARIALDDFGAGYSNLLYLQKYPVDILKVDREIIQGIGACLRSEAILDSVLRLTETLGVLALAEGIESANQARWLMNKMRRETFWAQGFLFGKPEPWDAMLARVQARGGQERSKGGQARE